MHNKITYLILIHLFLKNWGRRRRFIFILLERQCSATRSYLLMYVIDMTFCRVVNKEQRV